MQAQLQSGAAEKISPTFISFRKSLDKNFPYLFFVVVSDTMKFKQLLVERNLLKNIITEHKASNVYLLKSNLKSIDSILIPSSFVTFVDIVRKPHEESVLDGFDLSTNRINRVHNRFKNISGNGTTVSVKENKPDTTDIDLRGRFISTPLASPSITSHATIMSTIVAGAGNSHYTGKGVAWGATITSSNFANLLPDADSDYSRLTITVQNHSYGTGIENYYGADALAYDASTGTNPSLVHVFSAGNAGDKVSTNGPFVGIQGYSNVTGSFKMAKNILVVGSVDSFYNISLLSSKGPSYDGRVTPQLGAFGLDGSSGAAAIVSGTALLLQQAYKDANNDQLPSSALIRSILLNTADDTGPTGIDFQSGYGNLNAGNAINALVSKWYRSGIVAEGQKERFQLDIPPNVNRLKITICWNDVPGKPNDRKSLVNDIDMRLISDLTGSAWQPWVLNSYPHLDSLAQLPTRKKDSINNTEQITIDQPASGPYTIEITGYEIPSGSQPYSLSYQWDTVNHFQWEYPTAMDVLQLGKMHTLRWTSTFNATNARLFYSRDSGHHWELIADNIDPSKNYYKWNADTPGIFMLRMEINNQSFISDTSLIASQLSTYVGFNCVDSFLIYWNKHLNASGYTVYQLGNKYLDPFKVVPDTSIVLKKSINKVSHYAVAPIVQGKIGNKSYTIDYTTQGIGCYVKRFTVDLLNSSVGSIQLELGTRYEIFEVSIEKWLRDRFVPFRSIADTSRLQFNFTDNSLVSGGNRYRVKIRLKNGGTIFSSIETIYYLAGKNYLVYPNPAKSNFVIVSNDADSSEFILYNTTGQMVLRKTLSSVVQNVPIPQLKRGLYFLIVRQRNKKVHQGSLIIQ